MWLSAGRDVVNKAVEKRLFGKAAKQSVTVLDGLADRIEVLLTRRFYDGLGLARRAGHIVVGFDQVHAALAGIGCGGAVWPRPTAPRMGDGSFGIWRPVCR